MISLGHPGKGEKRRGGGGRQDSYVDLSLSRRGGLINHHVLLKCLEHNGAQGGAVKLVVLAVFEVTLYGFRVYIKEYLTVVK